MRNQKIRFWLIVFLVILATTACTLPSFAQLGFNNSNTADATSEPVAALPAGGDTAATEEVTHVSVLVPDEVYQEDALVNIYQTVSPGVVSIQVYTPTGYGQGSGFVVDKEGHIVTNYHVVDGATTIEVHFQSGIKVYGEVVGVDLDSDIAVVKVDVDPDDLIPLVIGNSDQVYVGQTVVAIGNPYGLNGTMTVGIVSARGRTMESIRQTTDGTYFSTGDLIQTDANINPGNSGGPLLNLNGEVIGINRAIQTTGTTISGTGSNTGIGFAVSSNILSLVLPSLVNGETYEYPYLGLSAMSTLSLTQAEYLNLSQATGAYVLEVVSGGPSDQAGLRAGDQPTEVQGLYAGGDLIIAVDGQEILQFSDMLNYMMLNKQPGDTMDITVLRDGQELTLTVVLGERSSSGQ
jgi:2-alkenal reductase